MRATKRRHQSVWVEFSCIRNPLSQFLFGVFQTHTLKGRCKITHQTLNTWHVVTGDAVAKLFVRHQFVARGLAFGSLRHNG